MHVRTPVAFSRSAMHRPTPGMWFVAGALLATLCAFAFLAWPAAQSPRATASEALVEMPDGRTLLVQKYEVTIAQWNACNSAGACELRLRPRSGQAASNTPATGLSHVDVQQYLRWINVNTTHDYRLPTAAEWSAMARDVLPDAPDPIFTDPALSWASVYLTDGIAPREIRPSGGFSTSPAGVSDLDGSVWEWTQDCYSGEGQSTRCPAYFVGGEHLAAMSFLVRDPARGGCAVGTPPAHLGFRLVRD